MHYSSTFQQNNFRIKLMVVASPEWLHFWGCSPLFNVALGRRRIHVQVQVNMFSSLAFTNTAVLPCMVTSALAMILKTYMKKIGVGSRFLEIGGDTLFDVADSFLPAKLKLIAALEKGSSFCRWHPLAGLFCCDWSIGFLRLFFVVSGAPVFWSLLQSRLIYS